MYFVLSTFEMSQRAFLPMERSSSILERVRIFVLVQDFADSHNSEFCLCSSEKLSVLIRLSHFEDA